MPLLEKFIIQVKLKYIFLYVLIVLQYAKIKIKISWNRIFKDNNKFNKIFKF